MEKCRSLLGQLNTDKHKPAVCSGLAREITDLNCYGLTSNAVYADPQKKVCDVTQCQALWSQLNTDKHKPAVCSGLAREITNLNCYGLTSNAVYADPQKKVCDVTQCQALWSQLATQRTTSACVGLVTQIQNLSCYQVTQNSVYNLPAATAYCSGN